jgi:hypothetical protein
MPEARPALRFRYLVDRGPSYQPRPAARLVQVGMTLWFVFGHAWPAWPPGLVRRRHGPDIPIHTFEDFVAHMALPFLFTVLIVLMAEPPVHGLGPQDLWNRLVVARTLEAEVTMAGDQVCLLSGSGDLSSPTGRFRAASDGRQLVLNFGGDVIRFEVDGTPDDAENLVRQLEGLAAAP